MNERKDNKGFVAITLVITISTLLIAFVYARSTDIASFFDQTQTKEYRIRNYYFAYNCIDRVMLNLAHDYFYEVSKSVNIPDLYCSIDEVKEENGIKKIKVHGNFKNLNVKRSATARLYDNKLELISID